MDIQRLALVLAGSTLAHATAAQQADITPPNRTYELSVATADGGSFRDCATFGANHALVLLAGRGLVIDWLPETAASSERNFHAVTDGSRMAANPIGLALHGSFVGRDAIRGNAINDLGLTFTFDGRLNGACASTADYYRESPYAAAPAIPLLFEPEAGSVAGKLYSVRLYGAGATDDCFHFVINGTLSRNGGENLTWAMDRLNDGMGTFQAVAASASATAGLALHGQLTSWGELRVLGIENDGAGLREIVGSGREAHNCIDD